MYLCKYFENACVVFITSFANWNFGSANLLNNSTLCSLLSLRTSTSRTAALWDFEVRLVAGYFDEATQYYLQATVDLTFENTGTLRRRLNIDAGDMVLEVFSHNARDFPTSRDPLFSQIFLPVSENRVELVNATATITGSAFSSQGVPIIVAVGAIVGAIICSLVAVGLLYILKRKRKASQSAAHSDAPLPAK
jgi:hypothetical protein